MKFKKFLHVKKVKHKRKKIKTTMDWMDVEDIDSKHILLRKSKVDRIVKGIKIKPPNIFLEESHVQRVWIDNLKYALSRIDFEIFHNFVYTPIELTPEMDRLHILIENEEDENIKELHLDELRMLEELVKTKFELSFFILIKGKSNSIDDHFTELKKAFYNYGFQFDELNSIDFRNLLSYEFNNELINEFLFTEGIFSVLKGE